MVYLFQRVLRRGKTKRGKMAQDDKITFEQFQDNLRKERTQAAGKYLSRLNNSDIPKHCQIYGQVYFQYDDGNCLLVDVAIVGREQDKDALKDAFYNHIHHRNNTDTSEEEN